MSKKITAVILIGHGSLRSASGSAMIRIATRLREQGLAPLVEAAFLNYNRPTLAEAVAKCQTQGATKIIIQPYFLIEGVYVRNDLPALVRTVAVDYPTLRFEVAEAFGDHPALAKLALKRAGAVDSDPAVAAGLLFVAHGTPLEGANAPINRVLRRAQTAAGYGQAAVGYLDCNQPDIPTAIANLATSGVERIVAVPYFLQLGRHVRDDLPTLFAQAQQHHPHTEIRPTEPLGYDLLLAEVAAERVMASMTC
ncbi:MAG: sirohydrochlorin chelatase [Chloroflexota bacterium]|nr:sirohydrochlorin chelatase [Chloroflexota bacterium]